MAADFHGRPELAGSERQNKHCSPTAIVLGRKQGMIARVPGAHGILVSEAGTDRLAMEYWQVPAE